MNFTGEPLRSVASNACVIFQPPLEFLKIFHMCLAKCVRPTAGAVPPQATIGMGAQEVLTPQVALVCSVCILFIS